MPHCDLSQDEARQANEPFTMSGHVPHYFADLGHSSPNTNLGNGNSIACYGARDFHY